MARETVLLASVSSPHVGADFSGITDSEMRRPTVRMLAAVRDAALDACRGPTEG